MNYQFRIPVEERYLAALGRATYNFTYLEWGVVWIIEKLSAGYVNSVSGKTAGAIAGNFKSTLSQQSLPPTLAHRLPALASKFEALVEKRNGLIHANPMTGDGGAQHLRDSGRPGKRSAFEWTENDILDLAREFELAAIEASDIFHKELA